MRSLLQYEYSRSLHQIADFLEVAHSTDNPMIHGITLNSAEVKKILLQLAKITYKFNIFLG